MGSVRERYSRNVIPSVAIFTALWESACMRRGKTMSWCCLISGDERSAIKPLGYARNDDAREALLKLRGASDFYAPHHHSSLLTPHSSLLTPNWRAKLLSPIKGQHAPRANPEPRTLSTLNAIYLFISIGHHAFLIIIYFSNLEYFR